MIELNDKNIRAAFKQRLTRSKQKPKAIIEELRVHNGNAIADIVTLHKEAHCYEIKGHSDKIERALTQATFYDKTFRKITLITTKNHLTSAEKKIPDHWGIIEANNTQNKINFRYIRAAKTNRKFIKNTALLTLWRDELIDLVDNLPLNQLKKLNRNQLAESISKKLSKEQTSTAISSLLSERHATGRDL